MSFFFGSKKRDLIDKHEMVKTVKSTEKTVTAQARYQMMYLMTV